MARYRAADGYVESMYVADRHETPTKRKRTRKMQCRRVIRSARDCYLVSSRGLWRGKVESPPERNRVIKRRKTPG